MATSPLAVAWYCGAERAAPVAVGYTSSCGVAQQSSLPAACTVCVCVTEHADMYQIRVTNSATCGGRCDHIAPANMCRQSHKRVISFCCPHFMIIGSSPAVMCAQCVQFMLAWRKRGLPSEQAVVKRSGLQRRPKLLCESEQSAVLVAPDACSLCRPLHAA